MSRKTTEIVFEALTSDDDGRVCADISDAACREQADSFTRHVACLSLSKAADGLADPKLVLSWLMSSLGAPAFLVGFLVPIREAGALLPQLFTAARIRAMERRKWAWAGASAAQGLAVIAMAISALSMEGAAAGIAILIALAVLAVARSVASVSYKDVLGKTIAKGRRGTATGLATSVGSAAVIAFALVLILDWGDRMGLVIGALVIAGAAWIGAAVIFAGLSEEAGATEGGANGFAAGIANFKYLREDEQLQRFILARGLLTATALAPPYLVLLSTGVAEQALSGLGALVLASALAALVSGYVWGRLADRSSRQVLMATAALGAAALIAALMLPGWALAGVLFVLMLAHQGVRVGRSTHLVDMAPPDLRAVYTALSNTLIGVVLLAGGVFGGIASLFGPEATIAVFAVMALGGGIVAAGLAETGEKE
jgi:hypothetical protein